MNCGYSNEFMAERLGRNTNYVRQIKWQIRNRDRYAEQQRHQYERKKQCSASS
jgi:hypothetical protein